MKSILERYQQLNQYPGGNALFGFLVGINAPFSGKIRPKFITLKPAYCETQIKDRWGVRNHLGSINAGALCSMAEMTGGLALDTIVPKTLRWIPRSMSVEYIAKAKGTITATSEFNPDIVKEGDVIIPIIIRNKDKQVVFTAQITFYISSKKQT